MDYLVYNLADLPADTAELPLLPPDEQLQATQRGGHYAAIRSLLRRELERRSGIPAQEIVFSYTQHGKPEFPPQPFNLSHSGDCLCLAFHHQAIGVDVEQKRPRRNLAALATRMMCPEQSEAFCSRDCPLEEFYACWCAAEAIVKLAGDTMWNARSYPFLYNNGRIRCLFDPAPSVTLFTPMPGYMGAVAFHSPMS